MELGSDTLQCVTHVLYSPCIYGHVLPSYLQVVCGGCRILLGARERCTEGGLRGDKDRWAQEGEQGSRGAEEV